MLNRKVWGPPYQTCLWPRASLGESGWVAKEFFFRNQPDFFSGYDGSEMMSLEEEISHLHKENSHVMIIMKITFLF